MFAIIDILSSEGIVPFQKDKINVNKDLGLEIIPCNNATIIELGNPYVGKEVSEFTTNGGTFYVKSQKFDHAGIMTPEQYNETIYIGEINKLPIWDHQKGIVVNAAQKINFKEGNYGEIRTSSGRYWLWSGGGDVILVSCDPNGVSDPKPVK